MVGGMARIISGITTDPWPAEEQRQRAQQKWDAEQQAQRQARLDYLVKQEEERRDLVARQKAASEAVERGRLDYWVQSGQISQAEGLEALAKLMLKYPEKYQTPEGATMAQSTVDQQIKAKLEERRVEREVTARLALVDGFGEDTYDNGTVITFEKKFTGVKDVYTYAAIKRDDKWFSTGHDCVSGTTFTWDTLVEFLVTGPFPVASVIIKAAGGTVFPAPKEETK